jgi:hypothetical protein
MSSKLTYSVGVHLFSSAGVFSLHDNCLYLFFAAIVQEYAAALPYLLIMMSK